MAGYLAGMIDHLGYELSITDCFGINPYNRRVIDEFMPEWLRLSGFWYPRGGMPIDVWYQTSLPPDKVHIPDPGVSPYRGRG